MADKSKNILFMIGGGYLIYVGSRLVVEIRKSEPSNETVLLAFGAFFVIFGIIILAAHLVGLYKIVKSEKTSDTIVEKIEFEEEIMEIVDDETEEE